MPRAARNSDATPVAPRQRVKPVQARSRKKIDAILDAASLLLEKHGIDAVTTVAIAEQAGVPPPTVYHYFENRLAIFAALASRIADQVDAKLIALIEKQLAGGAPDIRMLLQHLYDAYASSPGYLAVMAALRGEPTLQAVVSQSNERVAHVIGTMLQQVTPLPPVRAQRVAYIVSESCDAVLQAALTRNSRNARELITELAYMIDVLFRHYGATGETATDAPATPRARARKPRA